MKAKTFEGRMAFFILISVMVTGATEYLTFHLIRVVSEYLRENGYRSLRSDRTEWIREPGSA